MFRRKLTALDYPRPDEFDVKNESGTRQLVVWLEDQKIRHRKIEDRATLRDTASTDWDSALQQYLSELNCPYMGRKREVVIDWLLGYAVRLEYSDDVESFKTVKRPSASSSGGSSSNPLNNLNFDDAEFKAGVTSLAMLLQIPPHKDHLEQLKAISSLVTNKLSKEALEINASSSKDSEHIPLDKTELGFEAGDYILNDVAKIVRLLHLKELRDLQSKINAAIVVVQAITADPKTDSRLGKVGR